MFINQNGKKLRRERSPRQPLKQTEIEIIPLTLSSPAMVLKSNAIQQKQPLADHSRSSSVDSSNRPQGKTNAQFGEVCGGTTADVAAVCCCCPCGLANLIVLAICKVPAGLFRKAQRQKRLKKQQKKGVHQPKNHGGANFRADDPESLSVDDCFQDVESSCSEETKKAAVELENEMWHKFFGTGFWRSPSLVTPRSQSQ
ncbi:Detected protein of unknown function [Hibiscus syriacus]|uniref:Uncharacterized protein n=1 Tax=Hibiscus syriacus TaxID=106335 RepID=A0A6A3BLX3_HIBSY|nr:Detected protein of unknown function [Hibiscus syriacus]